MRRKRKRNSLPKPPPPTKEEIAEMLQRKADADYDMAFHDNFSPALRALGRKYPGYAWQVEKALACGWPEAEIIRRVKNEHGES